MKVQGNVPKSDGLDPTARNALSRRRDRGFDRHPSRCVLDARLKGYATRGVGPGAVTTVLKELQRGAPSF